MHNAHSYFSLKNLGKKVHIIHGKIRYLFPLHRWKSKEPQRWRDLSWASQLVEGRAVGPTPGSLTCLCMWALSHKTTPPIWSHPRCWWAQRCGAEFNFREESTEGDVETWPWWIWVGQAKEDPCLSSLPLLCTSTQREREREAPLSTQRSLPRSPAVSDTSHCLSLLLQPFLTVTCH